MNKTNNKKKIIASSTRLFNKYGFENVTVNQIIEETQTSKGTFYHYFKTKDELLVYVLDVYDDAIKKYVRTLPKDIDALDKIRRIVQHIFELYQINNTTISLANAKQVYHTQLVSKDKFVLNEDRYMFVLFTGLAEEAIRKGEVPSGADAKEIASTIMMIMRGVFFNWYLCDTQFDVVSKGSYLMSLYLHDLQHPRE